MLYTYIYSYRLQLIVRALNKKNPLFSETEGKYAGGQYPLRGLVEDIEGDDMGGEGDFNTLALNKFCQVATELVNTLYQCKDPYEPVDKSQVEGRRKSQRVQNSSNSAVPADHSKWVMLEQDPDKAEECQGMPKVLVSNNEVRIVV